MRGGKGCEKREGVCEGGRGVRGGKGCVDEGCVLYICRAVLLLLACSPQPPALLLLPVCITKPLHQRHDITRRRIRLRLRRIDLRLFGRRPATGNNERHIGIGWPSVIRAFECEHRPAVFSSPPSVEGPLIAN